MKGTQLISNLFHYMRMFMQAHMYMMCSVVMPMMPSPEALYNGYDYVERRQ